MIYILKDKSDNSIKENDNIIEITREQAHIILQNHSKSYIERKRQKELKNKKHNEKRSKKKLEKIKKHENMNNKNNLKNENFKKPKVFLDELNKENINITPEEITNDNYNNAIFSIVCLILIVIIACYFQYKNHNEIQNQKNNFEPKVDYLLLNE